MSEALLLEIQTALLADSEPGVVKTVEVAEASPRLESTSLSPILTGYLDTLLRSATEVPPERTVQTVPAESLLESFKCLHFVSAGRCFLMPLSRIARIDHGQDRLRRFAFSIPECMSSGRYMVRIGESRNWLFFDELAGLKTVYSRDVIWRGQASRAPWFTGTHRELLCRIFDPEVLMKSQGNVE